MSATGLEIKYWEGPVSIGAHRPYNLRPYGRLSTLHPAVVFIAAMAVNVAFATLLLLGTRPSPELMAALPAGDPSGSILQVHIISQLHPRAIPISASRQSPPRRRPDEDDTSRPKSLSTFAPQHMTSGDVMDTAALKAIYRGQLQARLERTRPPPTAMDAMLHSPRCRLRVDQDVDGRIEELQILTCTGSPMWRDALMSSIRSAAPLPMPPHAALYSPSLEIDVGDAISVRLISEGEATGEPIKGDPVSSTF